MKKFVLILLSFWVVRMQTPLAMSCGGSAAGAHACKCCTDCDGSCGCVSSCDSNQLPQPLAIPSTSLQTELLFPAAPASMLALPFTDPADDFFSLPLSAACSAVPLFYRDCALRL